MGITKNKFGAFKGVFVPSILTILGVILFLRLGWVVGQAGIVSTIFIICLSCLITLITSFSISSAATNTEVGPGGSYFLISRCFGLEPGAAIGLPLYLAQTLGISFYVVGFAESLALFIPEIPVKYVALGTLFVLTALTFKSSSLALKSQIIIFIVIIVSLISFAIGSPIETAASAAIKPEPFETFSFWAIFAVFFPAVTGIEAGISMSGDLENPRKSLPSGTLAAVILGFFVYVLFAIKFHTVASPEVLVSNSLLMTEVAAYGILIYIGLWGATLSSTLGALLGAPRTMQALAKDRLLPYFLSQGSKETNEPQVATFVSSLIAAAGIMIGDLNAIAAILSMFFLTSYGALNLVSGLESLLANPSWRPTFKTPWIISIIGAFLCFGAMFMINSGSSFIAIGLVICVYLIMKKRGMRSRYSDIRGGLISYFARELIYIFDNMKANERNWRPNFLILSGAPKSRLYLIDLANSISHKRGFMTVASILQDTDYDIARARELESAAKEFLHKKGISSLVKIIYAKKFSTGAKSLVQNYGIGKLTPNTVVLGDCETGQEDYIKVIFDCFETKKNLLIVRSQNVPGNSHRVQGKYIDVWWKGEKGNLGLMLTLSYMLTLSKRWRGAQMTLKSVASSQNERSGVLKSMEAFIAKSRIHAKVEVLVGEEDAFDQIRESSKHSDLIFFGLKEPEDLKKYHTYYNNLISKTKGFPNAVFVLKGEDANFGEIFV